jgi:hypothetical protein
MFSKIFYGAVLGSLVFAATETYVHAATEKGAPRTVKRFKYSPKTDVTRGQTAPELGFVVDILDMNDWKGLRKTVKQGSFTTLNEGQAKSKTAAK